MHNSISVEPPQRRIEAPLSARGKGPPLRRRTGRTGSADPGPPSSTPATSAKAQPTGNTGGTPTIAEDRSDVLRSSPRTTRCSRPRRSPHFHRIERLNSHRRGRATSRRSAHINTEVRHLLPSEIGSRSSGRFRSGTRGDGCPGERSSRALGRNGRDRSRRPTWRAPPIRLFGHS